MAQTCLSRQVNIQIIRVRSVVIIDLLSLCKVTERNLDCISTSHEGSLERVRLRTLSIGDHTCCFTITCPYVIAEGVVEFCQDCKHIHVRHNRLDIIIRCQACNSRCSADGVATCTDLYDCQIAEGHITLDSRIRCCFVLCNQTTCHPEAYRTIVSYAVINTGTLCGVVSGDLTTVQGEGAVVHDTTTVAAVVTTLDLCTAYVVRNSERTVIDDYATVLLCACEVTIQAKAVQIQDYRLTCRYDQSTVEVRSRQTLAQLQDTTVRHSCIQICPSSDSTADLVHIGLSDITVDTRDLTVSIRRYVQYLMAQPRLCRQVDIQIIRERTVSVIYFLCLCKVTERNLDRISTSHKRCLERVRLGTLCIGDHTCCFTITCPYIIAESIVQLLQQKIVVSFFGSRQCTIVTYRSLECINSLGITTIISQSFISITSCVNFRFTCSSIFYGTDSIDKALDIVCCRTIYIRTIGNSTGGAVDRHGTAYGSAGIATFTYTVCSFTTFGRFQIFDTIRDSDVTALRFPTAVLCLSATDTGTS